jgi:hypothetical protein
VIKAGLVVGAAGLLTGCGSPRLGRYDLVVTPDASLREGQTLPPLKVDVVGVKPTDVTKWQAYSVDVYFSGSDDFRNGFASSGKQLSFDAAADKPQTISAKDPIWETWDKAGVRKVFVLANARTMRPPQVGVDARKAEIPMTTDRWDVSKIDIVIRASGVDVTTPMKPVKE